MTPRSSHACWRAGGRNAPDETNSRKSPPSWRWTLPEERGGGRASGRCRAIAAAGRTGARPAALRRPPARSRSRTGRGPGGRRPSRSTRCVAERLEDDPRVAAPDVQDVGADVERVDRARPPARRGGRAAAARRPGAPSAGRPGGTPGSSASDVVVGEHHALRRAGGARGEDQLEDVLRAGARPGATLRLPVGRERRVVRRRRTRASTVVVGKRSSPASRGSGASRPVPRIRWRGSGRARRCPRSRPAPSAGRAGRGRGRPASPRSRPPAAPASTGDQVRIRSPGSRPSAAQPPRGEPAPSVELAIASSAVVDAVVAPQRERRPVAEPRDRVVEQVEQGRHRFGQGTRR